MPLDHQLKQRVMASGAILVNVFHMIEFVMESLIVETKGMRILNIAIKFENIVKIV